MSLAFSVTNDQPLPLRPGRRILHEVCEKHGLLVSDVTGVRRFAALVRCRFEVAGRLASETKLSLPQIGALLGKDHTTVLMAVRRWNEITGRNIRGLGGIPQATRERNRRSCEARRKEMTRRDRLRRSELQQTKREFIRSESVRLFALGFDTADISLKLNAPEHVVASALAEARDEGRGQ